MAARLTIIGTGVFLFFIPLFLLALFSPSNGEPQYLTICLIPFFGTCPFPLGQPNTLEEVDYWPFYFGLLTAGLGIGGIVSKKIIFSAAFLVIIILSWGLTFLRLF